MQHLKKYLFVFKRAVVSLADMFVALQYLIAIKIISYIREIETRV